MFYHILQFRVQQGCIVQTIQMENAGEKKDAKEQCIKERLEITSEDTALIMPQQTAIVEHAITTPYKCMKPVNHATWMLTTQRKRLVVD